VPNRVPEVCIPSDCHPSQTVRWLGSSETNIGSKLADGKMTEHKEKVSIPRIPAVVCVGIFYSIGSSNALHNLEPPA
jgi:hypothetical protein